MQYNNQSGKYTVYKAGDPSTMQEDLSAYEYFSSADFNSSGIVDYQASKGAFAYSLVPRTNNYFTYFSPA
mgnify:FL=1